MKSKSKFIWFTRNIPIASKIYIIWRVLHYANHNNPRFIGIPEIPWEPGIPPQRKKPRPMMNRAPNISITQQHTCSPRTIWISSLSSISISCKFSPSLALCYGRRWNVSVCVYELTDWERWKKHIDAQRVDEEQSNQNISLGLKC